MIDFWSFNSRDFIYLISSQNFSLFSSLLSEFITFCASVSYLLFDGRLNSPAVHWVNDLFPSSYEYINICNSFFLEWRNILDLILVNCPTITLAGIVINQSGDVTVRGVVLDQEMTFKTHIKRLAIGCFYQLRQRRSVRNALTSDASKTMVHEFRFQPPGLLQQRLQSHACETPATSSIRLERRRSSHFRTK